MWTAIIPARAGSKGVPNKNIKELGGKPLIYWTIQQVKASGVFDSIWVSTDSRQYADLALSYGARVLFRPKNLAQDATPMVDVLAHHVINDGIGDDNIMLLQPTSPFRTVESIKRAKQIFEKRIDIDDLSSYVLDSLISVSKVPDQYNPAKMIYANDGLLMLVNGKPVSERITRRQDFPDAHIPTGSIYCMRRELLLRGKPTIYGDNVGYLLEQPMINIDTMDDWLEAEQYIENKNG